ncbi:MAG TPA: hypothetical protein VFA50_17190 [Stellaceae bacterium]|nr:hypothetical protein [Stellaceae bacterium]
MVHAQPARGEGEAAHHGAARLGGGEEPDEHRRDAIAFESDGRDQRRIGEAEDIGDDGHQDDDDKHGMAAHDRDALGDIGGDADEVEPARLLAEGEARHDERRRRIGARGQGIGAGEAAGLEKGAAEQRPQHARQAARHRIERHRRPDMARLHHLADHASSHRHLARPASAADDAAHDDMPELDALRRGERAERRRIGSHDGEPTEEQRLAVPRLGDDPGERPQEHQRQRPRHGDEGDGEGRAGEVESEDAGDQHFEPAHGIGETARRPEPQIARRSDERAQRRRPAWRRRDGVGSRIRRARTVSVCRPIDRRRPKSALKHSDQLSCVLRDALFERSSG